MRLQKIMRALFGSRNDRLLKQFQQTVLKINALEPHYEALSAAELGGKTAVFQKRYQQGETLDQLLPEAFAAVREASKRTLGMRHFDVQLIGGMVLHAGKIAEMSTGEGKTLMATLAAYLNALSGHPVHIVTVNDYLARRDADWMRPVYSALGLEVGVVVPNQPREEKQQAYRCSIIYATNNELGFDYLRDRMVYHPKEQVQGLLFFAIVDEVDSILVDEARTPLVISGSAEDSSALYRLMNDQLLPLLQADDYSIDEKAKQVFLTEMGHQKVESLLQHWGLLRGGRSLYDPLNVGLMHHVTAALRAATLFKKDIDYIVAQGQVVIVDEHTGRTMQGRRWSDGLHQALEAKERVEIQQENQTLASITFQNFFRLYDKLSGMTGTADTEAYEFHQIYGLEVVVIPTNRPCRRIDHCDLIYLTQAEKFEAIVEAIVEAQQKGQPVLVGTISIEASEQLSAVLRARGVQHNVLNAKYHEQEARIIAEAGRPGAVTIATNMAGRGTDIVLGGSLEAELKAMATADEVLLSDQMAHVRSEWQERHDAVIAAGGLRIIGTERHESRRIDNQLRGRSGRQGDPGASQFYLSLEDNLMRIFASDKMSGIMRKLGVEPGEAITHPWVTRAIENAQKKVEGHHFDIRKQLLQYDDVANEQRKAIYRERDALLHDESVADSIETMREEVIADLLDHHVPVDSLEEQWDIPGLERACQQIFGREFGLSAWISSKTSLDPVELNAHLRVETSGILAAKEAAVGAPLFRQLEKSIVLQALDLYWKEHLSALEHLRQSIHLRGYAQKDPKQEYRREAFELFSQLLKQVKKDVIRALAHVQIQESPVQQAEGVESGGILEKRARNEPCYCGSGKKFKHCHGVLA